MGPYNSEKPLERNFFYVNPDSDDDGAWHAASAGLAPTTFDPEKLSLEEKLRRERARDLSVGITSFASCAQNPNRFLIPYRGSIFVQDGVGEKAQARCVYDKATADGGHGAIDPHISPDGKRVAFVIDKELVVVSAEQERGVVDTLTEGARGVQGVTNGLADFIAQEEMHRAEGFWWCGDSKHIAFERCSEAHIPTYTIMHQGNLCEEAQETHKYPFAGKANPSVSIGVLNSSDGARRVTWLDLGPEKDTYVCRVQWLPDKSLAVQVQSRDQCTLQLRRYTPLDDANVGYTVLLEEKTDMWINLTDTLIAFPNMMSKDECYFIWQSERTGYSHLYLYKFTGSSGACELIRAITKGNWIVEGVLCADVANQIVFFHGTLDSPLEKHVYYANIFSGDPCSEPVRVTDAGGMNGAIMDKRHAGVAHPRANSRAFVVTRSQLGVPPRVTLYRALISRDGSETSVAVVKVRDIFNAAEFDSARLEKFGAALAPPELISFKTNDDVTLHGALYRPDTAIYGSGPFPLAVSLYGGPGPQLVSDSFNLCVNMRGQRLRENGFAVLTLDNRGSSRRGLVFEGFLKHSMGTVEVADQVAGVKYCVNELKVADPERVCVYGWSYGGYLSLMCLCKAPSVFKAALSGAPVTRWEGYDTHYTERYMGTPKSNPDGYKEGSVLTHVHNLDAARQKLLLIHGLLDENVHFRHTSCLINKLIEHRFAYDLMLFPEERHMPRQHGDRCYMEDRIFDFLMKNVHDINMQRIK